MKPVFVLPAVAMLAAAASSTGLAKEVVKTTSIQGGAAFRAVKAADIQYIDYNGTSYQGARNTSTSSARKVVATVPVNTFPASEVASCGTCHSGVLPNAVQIGVDAYHTTALTTPCVAFSRDPAGEIQASQTFDVISTGAGPTYGATMFAGLVAYGRSVSVQCDLPTNQRATLIDIFSFWTYDDGLY